MTETTKAPPADPNTGAGLIEFLDAAIEKGWFNVGSAKALKTATQKIFEVESGWASMDLRSLDADSLFDRFVNLKRNSYSDDSMRLYRTRFRQALRMHLARLDKDANWRTYGPAARPNSPAKAAPNGAAKPPKTDPAPSAKGPAEEDDLPAQGASTGTVPLMRFPFPLRDTVDVWLTLPRDLSADEADRLSVFIHSLARQSTPAPAAASEEG